jgi:hypothetical protein
MKEQKLGLGDQSWLELSILLEHRDKYCVSNRCIDDKYLIKIFEWYRALEDKRVEFTLKLLVIFFFLDFEIVTLNDNIFIKLLNVCSLYYERNKYIYIGQSRLSSQLLGFFKKN